MIRIAVPDDAAEVCVIWNWMIRETLATFTTQEKTTDEVMSAIKSRAGAFWVAEDGDMLQGFATFARFRSGPGYAATVEHSIVVRPAGQGQGVGTSLLNTAMLAATDQGKHVMVGAISSANAGAVRFHEALGFRQTGCLSEVGRKNGQWLDLILMQKILAEHG